MRSPHAPGLAEQEGMDRAATFYDRLLGSDQRLRPPGGNSMTRSSWWHAVPTPIAFLVAPLVVPLLAVLFLDPPLSEPSIVGILFGVTFATYVGVAAFGIPTFLFLRSRQWTEFWVALVAGFIIGTTMWYVGVGLFALSLGNRLSDVLSRRLTADEWSMALRVGALAGAAVGAILWLIARPDRRVRSDEDRDQRT